MKKIQKGFTLIELMIVVAIIGILAAIALPKFADMLEKSREGATKGNFTAIKSAINLYTADQQGILPTDLTASHAAGGQDVNFVKKYLDKIPPVKATGKSDVNLAADAGKGPGVGAESTTAYVTVGTYSSPAFVNTQVGKGWKFDTTEGKHWVNSTMLDMNNNAYTVYGYQ